MKEIQSELVTAFNGIKIGSSTHPRINRNHLDEPYDLLNLHVTDRGALWMPPVPSLWRDMDDFTGVGVSHLDPQANTGNIVQVHPFGIPGDVPGVLVQQARDDGLVSRLWLMRDEAYDPVGPYERYSASSGGTSLGVSTTQTPIWCVSLYDVTTISGTRRPYAVFVGNQGFLGRLAPSISEDTDLSLALTTLTGTANTVCGTCAAEYAGRLWIGRQYSVGSTADYRGNRVWFSNVNTPEVFAATSYFDIPSRKRGLEDMIMALVPWNDQLVVFSPHDIAFIRGDSQENFRVQVSRSAIGAAGSDVICQWNGGLVFLSTASGKEGVYFFNGSDAQLLSGDIGYFLRNVRETSPNQDVFDRIFERASAVVYDDYYVLSVPDLQSDRQMYVLHLPSGENGWSTIDNTLAGGDFDHPRVRNISAPRNPNNLILARGHKLYKTHRPLFRYNEANDDDVTTVKIASATFGYDDQDAPHQLYRFLGARWIIWTAGSGDRNLSAVITATTDTGATETSNYINLTGTTSVDPNSQIHTPFQLRGSSVKITLDIYASSDTASMIASEVTVESLELILTKKPAKVGRR